MALTKVTDQELADASNWWIELGRATLGSTASSLSLTGLAAKKYLKIMLFVPNAAADFDPAFRFNNDSGSTYFINESNNNGAAGGANVAQLYLGIAATTRRLWANLDISNVATEPKLASGKSTSMVSSGGIITTAYPQAKDIHSMWGNTSAQINRVDFINLSGTSSLPVGTELIVLGHD